MKRRVCRHLKNAALLTLMAGWIFYTSGDANAVLRAVGSSGGGGSAAIGSAIIGGTPNSGLFIDAAGKLGQDNANNYFNDSSAGLASNTNTAYSLGTGGDFTGSDTLNIYAQGDAYLPNSAITNSATGMATDGQTPGWTASSSRGTGGSPVISNTGDLVGTFGAWEYTGATPAYTPSGVMAGVARGATASNLGGELQFWTKADGGILTQRWTIGNDGGMVGASASANSLTVGPNGTTNPVLQVDSSVASQATGIAIQGRAAAGFVGITVTSTGTNEGMQLTTKGSGSFVVQPGGTSRFTVGTIQWLFGSLSASTTASPRFSVLNTADTTITASVEAPFAYWNLANGVRQHATGAISLQRDFRISGSTHNFVGASTITDLATFSADMGDSTANGAVTNIHAIYVPTKALTGAAITNSYGLTANAATGAANNFAAQFQGGATVFGGGINSTLAQTVLAGTTAGNITWSQPFQGGSYKEFVGFASGYENNSVVNQTITFTTPFINTPVIVANNTGLTVSVSTTTLTITAPNNTSVFSGNLIVEGF